MVQGLGFLSKKSWHTKNIANQEKVWVAEQRQAAEENKTKELAKQIQQEREQDELDQIAGKQSARLDRGIDWMYSGQNQNSEIAKADAAKEAEEFLLGKEVPAAAQKSDLDVGRDNTGVNAIVQAAATSAATTATIITAAVDNRPVEPSVSERNEAFRMRYEDPMFVVSMAAREKKAQADHKKELYDKVLGTADADDDESPSDRKRSKKERKREKKSRKHKRHADDHDEKKRRKSSRRRSPSQDSRSREHSRHRIDRRSHSRSVSQSRSRSRDRTSYEDQRRRRHDDPRDRSDRHRRERSRSRSRSRSRDRDDYRRRDNGHDDRRRERSYHKDDRYDNNTDGKRRYDDRKPPLKQDRKPPPKHDRDQASSHHGEEDPSRNKKAGYGLQGGSSSIRVQPGELGPNQELLRKKREARDGDRRRAKESASSRRRMTPEERAAALRDMESDAQHRDATRDRLSQVNKEEPDSASGGQGTGSFLHKMKQETHGVRDGQVSMSARLAQNRHTQQKSHESFL